MGEGVGGGGSDAENVLRAYARIIINKECPLKEVSVKDKVGFLLFVLHFPLTNVDDEGGEDDASGVEEEVEPVAAAAGGSVGLEEFYAAAGEDGKDEGEPQRLAGLPAFRGTEVFKPDDKAGYEPETEVDELVDIHHMAQGCLRHGHETHNEDENEPENGKGVVAHGKKGAPIRHGHFVPCHLPPIGEGRYLYR